MNLDQYDAFYNELLIKTLPLREACVNILVTFTIYNRILTKMPMIMIQRYI